MYMKSIETKRSGRKPYLSPDLNVFLINTVSILCASNMGGVTEEWEEIDLSSL